MMSPGTGSGPNFVNGLLQPTISMRPGEIQLWRVVTPPCLTISRQLHPSRRFQNHANRAGRRATQVGKRGPSIYRSEADSAVSARKRIDLWCRRAK